MKIKYINIDKLKKNTKLCRNITNVMLIAASTTLIGCSTPQQVVETTPRPTEEPILSAGVEEVFEVVPEINMEDIVIEQVDERKIVALTFDDGPSKYTEDLINVLNENNATATFFVIGTNVNRYPETLQFAYESGNEIAVHGYSHTSFSDMTLEEVQNEIDLTRQLVTDCGVECSNLVRPPYGSIDSEIMTNVDATFILWNVDPEDWKLRDKDAIKAEIIGKINDGDIILFHDLYGPTVEALAEILPELSSEYRFVSVSELFELKELECEENNKYYMVK